MPDARSPGLGYDGVVMSTIRIYKGETEKLDEESVMVLLDAKLGD